MIPLPKKTTKTGKPVSKIGKLIYVKPSGNFEILEQNKPFPALQKAKKRYIQHGYNPEKLKITYFEPQKPC
ncbi:MAG: hypothetical protein AAGU19_07880 [Prolixibacteraceae bacterium]